MEVNCASTVFRLSSCCPRLDDVCENRTGLATIAEHWLFVVIAYFCVFLPWAILNAFDFISNKWRTVKRTRRLGRRYLILLFLPICYVSIYAEAQRQIGNYQEMCAAGLTIAFNMFNVVRTLMGLMQINSFVSWCRDAALCVCIISEKEPVDDLENKLKINNSIVDNELFGTDLGVVLTWRKLKKGWLLRNCTAFAKMVTAKKNCIRHWLNEHVSILTSKLHLSKIDPSDYLTTENAMMCTIRWSGAFLCAQSDLGFCPPLVGRSTFREFFSRKLKRARTILMLVTFDFGMSHRDGGNDSDSDRNNDTQVCLPQLLGWEADWIYDWNVVNDGTFPYISVEGGAMPYSTSIQQYRLFDSSSPYSVEFENLLSSFPFHDLSHRCNRTRIVMQLVDSLILAKHLGSDLLRKMFCHVQTARFPTDQTLRKAWFLFLSQCEEVPPHGSELDMMFLNMTNIPVFPWRFLMIPLWKNWRVLQASAHHDNLAALYAGDTVDLVTYGLGNSREIFERCEEEARNHDIGSRHQMLGVVMDVVRTAIAEMIVSKRFTDTTRISYQQVEVLLSKQTSKWFESDDTTGLESILLWECQNTLREALSKERKELKSLMSDKLIMLVILAMPVLRLQDCVVGVSRTPETDANGSTVVSDIVTVRVTSGIAPQNVQLLIKIEAERKAILQLHCEESKVVHFRYESWINAAMGWMRGMEHENDDEMRNILPVNFGKPVIDLTPLQTTYKGSTDERSLVRVLTGWPIFDARVCQFEIDQWIHSCGSIIRQNSPQVPTTDRNFDNIVEQAEAVFKTISREQNSEWSATYS